MTRKLNAPMQFTQGTSAQIATQTMKPGEPVYDTTANTLVMGDGAKAGGHPLVNTTTDQSIAGNKTFTDPLKFPTAITIAANATPEQVLALLRSADSSLGVNVQVLLAALAGYLPLTGGTLSGGITNASGISRDELPSSYISKNVFRIVDTNNVSIGFIRAGYGSTGKSYLELRANTPGNKKDVGLDVVISQDGTESYLGGPTPSITAPNNAIYNKEALNRDFLSKSGGEIQGKLGLTRNNVQLFLKSPILDITEAPTGPVYSSLTFYDKNNVTVSNVETQVTTGKSVRLSLYAKNKKEDNSDVQSSIIIGANNDGTAYATCPPPRGTYTNDIATFKSMVDNCALMAKENLNIYVDAVNGSDTADLNNGRGLSADKPFKTFLAAVNYVRHHYVGKVTTNIILLTDITFSPSWFVCPFTRDLTVRSNSTTDIKTLNITVPFVVYGGNLVLTDIKVNGTASMSCLVGVSSYAERASLYIGERVTFSGTVTQGTARSEHCGTIFVANGPSDGGVTGPRYRAVECGIILSLGKGANALPGTSAGTTTTGGQYI